MIMATKTKSVPVAQKKKIQKTKFKKKSRDGSARKGPKVISMLFEVAPVLAGVLSGPAPKNVPRLLLIAINTQDMKTRKTIVLDIMDDLDDDSRNEIIRKHLSDEDKKNILLGKKASKMFSKK